VPERPALVIRGKSKWDEGFKNLTDAFSKLRAESDIAKLKANGRPLAIFVQSDDEGFTFDAMLPAEIDTTASPKLSEGISIGKSPGGQALKFEHRGAYDDIESTYEAIAAYLDEKGLSARDELIEEFVNETVGSDDTNLAVDIYVLLKP
jgi:effector-binding domain-containing protein